MPALGSEGLGLLGASVKELQLHRRLLQSLFRGGRHPESLTYLVRNGDYTLSNKFQVMSHCLIPDVNVIISELLL